MTYVYVTRDVMQICDIKEVINITFNCEGY